MTVSAPERIVVTGLGVVTALGHDIETFFANACDGKVAISKVTGFDLSGFAADRSVEIRDFDIGDFFGSDPEAAGLGRAKQMALAAAAQCFKQSGFPVGSDPFRIGVAVGFTQGESQTLERCTDRIAGGTLEDGDRAGFADFPPYTIPQAIARRFGAYGPNLTIGNACSAGNFAIGQAIDCLRNGEAVAMIAGGADAFSRYGYAGFSRLGAIAPDVPRPFSTDRHGMVPGEGAAMLLLETLTSATARGAVILAEVIGYGESSDAHHITQPSPAGIAQAARQALDTAGIDADAVSYLSVHGTGTQASDKAEAQAFQQVFGDRMPPLSSIKSMLGHAMGAASAIEWVASVLAMRKGFLPPTMNYLGPDESFPLDCVANSGREAEIEIVLKTASAFGGQNAAVVFRNYRG